MTEQELAAIEARADAATPGPWGYERSDGSLWKITYEDEDEDDDGEFVAQDEVFSAQIGDLQPSDLTWEMTHRNGEFVAHARADVPALLAEVRLLRRVVQDQQEESALYDAGVKAGIKQAEGRLLALVTHDEWAAMLGRVQATLEGTK